jgi:hypothetical protein
MSQPKMLSIWFFVGLMLTLLGIIITCMGIYFIFNPENVTAMACLNPSLWWGLIMFLSGLLFLVPSWLHYRSGKQA